MKAIVLKGFGDVSNLIPAELPVPSVTDDEVLVQVKAFSINPVDIKTRSGKSLAEQLKAFDPIILGWDIAGIITAVGSKVSSFQKGDEVFGMINFPGHGKAYSEYVAAPASQLAIKPTNISHEAAAAATLAALTAWQALVTNANIKTGNKVLIHSAAGGVGHYAVQIAKYLGAYVIGTSSAGNKDFVLGLGADQHINYKTQRFEEIVKDADLVLDTIGGDNLLRSFEAVKKGGMVITLPSGEYFTEKATAKEINVRRILVESNGNDMKEIASLLSKNIIHSHVSKTFTFNEVAAAHLQIETGKTIGKIVIVH